jgi:hypothetical protein
VFVSAGGALLSTAHAAREISFSHQASHSLSGAAYSQGSQFSVHSRVAVSAAAALVDLSNPLSEIGILSGSPGRQAILPVVVTAP